MLGMSIWVIKVTYRNFHNDVNFNEGYVSFDNAVAAILNKINAEHLERINEYTFLDNSNNIEYELRIVDVHE